MWKPDQLRAEVERAQRVMTLLNDPQSRAAMDQYLRELQNEAARTEHDFAAGYGDLI